MNQYDYITEKVYQITHQSGISNLSVSKSNNRLIIRYQDKFYELIFDTLIETLRSRLEKQIVYIYSCTQKQFFVAQFNIEECKLIQTDCYKILVTNISLIFFPQILFKAAFVPQVPESNYYIYDTMKKVITPPNQDNPVVFQSSAAAHELYCISNPKTIYLFDRTNHKNLAKIPLKMPAQIYITYVKQLNQYFLFIIYENLTLQIQTLVYLKEHQLRTVVMKKSQDIQLNISQSLISKFKLTNLYVQRLVNQSNGIFYSVVAKTQVADKSNLFIKTLLKYDDSQQFTAMDLVSMLYLNTKMSLIQACQYSEKIVFFSSNRAYLTRNLRVCDGIYEVNGKILSIGFQQIKDDEFLVIVSTLEKGIQIQIINLVKGSIINKEIELQLNGELHSSESQCLLQGQNVFILTSGNIIVFNKTSNDVKISNIQQKMRQLMQIGNQINLFVVENKIAKLFDFQDGVLSEQPYNEFEFDFEVQQMEYQQITDGIIFQINNKKFIMFSSQMTLKSSMFRLYDTTHFTLQQKQLKNIEKTKYGLTLSEHIMYNTDESLFAKTIATYPSESMELRQFLQLPNGYYSDSQPDLSLQFEQISQMFQNALTQNSSALQVFSCFLALNQLSVVERITKFNKNEVNPWLANYYSTLSDAKPTPSLSLEQLNNSQVIILAPVYHLVDIIFTAAQQEYKANKDPFKVVLYFVITNKLPLLANLFKLSKNEKIADFLRRDFNDINNQAAASKNAFTLVSKHQFDLAAAWFLIGKKYNDGIKLISGRQYMNNKWLAYRVIQLLFIQNIIEEIQYNILLQQLYDDLALEEDDYKAYDKFILRQIIAQKLNQENYLVATKEDLKIMISIYSNINSQSAKELTEEDMLKMSSFFVLLHYYSQNIKLSGLLIALNQRMQLQFQCQYLNVSYSRMCKDIGQKITIAYNYNIVKKEISNLAFEKDLMLSSIISTFKEKIITQDIETNSVEKLPYALTLIQYVYSNSLQFKSKYTNAPFILLGYLKKIQVDIYHKSTKLNLNWFDALVLYFTIQLACDCIISDATQFAIYSKVIELFEKQTSRECDVKSAGDIGALFKVFQKNLFSPFEQELIQLVVQDNNQECVEQFQILCEQLMLEQLQKIEIYPQFKQISAYIDSLRIQQKSLSISLNNIQNFQYIESQQYMIYMVKAHPIVLLLWNGKTVYVIKIFNKIPKFVQEIEAEYFNIGTNGIAVQQKDKIVNYKLIITQSEQNHVDNYQNQLLHLGQIEPDVKFVNTLQFDREQGSHFALQQSRHKMICISPYQLQIHFLQMSYLKTFERDLTQYVSGVQEIFEVKLVNENVVLSLCKKNGQHVIIKTLLNDLVYQKEQKFDIIELNFEGEHLKYFEFENQFFVIISSHKEFRCYHVIGNELIELKRIQYTQPNKKFLIEMYKQDEKWCCCNYYIRVLQNKLCEFCPYCGREVGVEGGYQVVCLEDVRVAVK